MKTAMASASELNIFSKIMTSGWLWVEGPRQYEHRCSKRATTIYRSMRPWCLLSSVRFQHAVAPVA